MILTLILIVVCVAAAVGVIIASFIAARNPFRTQGDADGLNDKSTLKD